MTVKDIIDRVIIKTGVDPLPREQTCDQIIIGSQSKEVTRIVSTFMATVDVIHKAAELGANFIITHEPTWFNGIDRTEWLEDDPVYVEKMKLIEQYGITIWRFHDHMHMAKEDGIYRGFRKEMGWQDYVISNPEGLEYFGESYRIPETTLEKLSLEFKKTLEMDVIQIVGDPAMKVERVGVLVGGGSLGLGKEETPMQLMYKNNLDLLICGDITEWTISAYVRDAAAMGMNKGMLILGHEKSEEMGMKHLGEWLESIVDGIPVCFIDSGEPFTYL